MIDVVAQSVKAGRGRRIPALDGVRGLAILLVVTSHAQGGVLPFGGPVGVTLFFVLSGYLITGILIRQLDGDGLSLPFFYLRRARRLLPGLTVLLVASLLLHLSTDGVASWWSETWPVVVYATNFRIMAEGWSSMGGLGYLWSLAVEEHFYLVWPVLLLMLPARSRERAIMILVAVCGLWRIWLMATNSDWNRVYLGSDTNAFGLLIGAFLASTRLPQFPSLVPWAALVFLGGLSSMSIGAEASALLSVLGVIGCAALVHAGAWGWRPLEIKWLGWLGLISYEVYLWQGLTLQFRINWLLQIAAALVLGWCTWNFIGQRFLVDRKLMARDTSVSGSVLKVGLLSIAGEPVLDHATQTTALGRGRNNLEN